MKQSEVNSTIYFLMLNSILWNDKACWDVAGRLAKKLHSCVFQENPFLGYC